MNQIEKAALPLLLTFFLWSCSGDNSQSDNALPPDPIVAVQVSLVARQTLPVNITVDGITDVRDRERVVSPIDGMVLQLSTEVGATVNSGDTVALIQTRDSHAAIVGAQRILDAATTDQAREEGRKAMQVARESQQVVPVLASRSGVVVDKMVSSGQVVSANADLVQIVDLSTLDFVARIPLQDLPRISAAEACLVRLQALPGQTFSATVKAMSAQSDRDNQTAPVRIDLPSLPAKLKKSLRVGMMGTASITVGQHPDVLVVPIQALLRDDIRNTYTLYRVGPDSLAHAELVDVVATNDSLAGVSSPSLREGMAVIVKGNYEVSDSSHVTIEVGDNK